MVELVQINEVPGDAGHIPGAAPRRYPEMHDESSTGGLCACGCGGAVRPGKRYLPSHSLRGPKSEKHKASIGAALISYHERQRAGMPVGKVCSKCGIFKLVPDFGVRKNTNSQGVPFMRSECRECRKAEARQKKRKGGKRTPAQGRAHHLRWRFGITHEDYERMLAEQGGGCAICGTKEPGRHKHFQIDHCHTTGKIRGLLCHRCNTGIGHLVDDPVRMRACADYIERSRS